ncbi:MAG: DedA family protein [Bacteroidota bacterium]
MEQIPEWVESMGYLGAFLGAALEGEILLLTFVQLGRLGYLNLYITVFSFGLGTLATDWFFFMAGRKQGRRFFDNRPKMKAKLEQMDHILQKRQRLLLMTYRFIYGFRIVLPVLFGLSSISLRHFAIYSIVGTIVWVASFSLAGYYFAEWIFEHLEWLKSNLWVLFVFLGSAVLIFWWLRKS